MHTFISRIKAARLDALKRLKDRTAGEHGAFDIASIIVGVVLLGILVGGIIATTQGLIPWAQDKAAKQDLTAVTTAQQVYKAASTDQYGEPSATYGTLAKLTSAPANLLSAELTSDVKFEADATATKYWAVKQGGSGKWFGVNSTTATPAEFAPTTATTDTGVLAEYKTANP